MKRPALWLSIERFRLTKHRIRIKIRPSLDNRLARFDPRKTVTRNLLTTDRAGQRARCDFDR